MIAILITAAIVVPVAIAWARSFERALPGMPVIGREVSVPTAICKPTAYRRNRFDPLDTRRSK